MDTANDWVEITPEDSVVPIYLRQASEEELAELDAINRIVEAEQDAANAIKDSALEKLAKLGLTSEEVKAIIGV